MKITNQQLKQIITEEVQKALLVEADADVEERAYRRSMVAATNELMRMMRMIDAKLNCMVEQSNSTSTRAKCANVKSY